MSARGMGTNTMNLTVIRLTPRGLLGRRRAILLVILPALLLVLAGLTRWVVGGAPDASASLASQFAMGTLLPLMCLLISTGVIGAEIDDGSIVYMLAKPIKRRMIVFSKMVVAIGAALVFAVLPTMLAVDDRGGRGRPPGARVRSVRGARGHRVHGDLRGARRSPPATRSSSACCTRCCGRRCWAATSLVFAP